MTLLDAYGLIAFLAGGPARTEVENLLRAGNVGVAAVNLVEVLDVSQRVHGVAVTRSWSLLEPMVGQTMAVLSLEIDTALRAAQLRVAHYHGRRCPISLADCVLLASAGAADRIATPDPDVLAVAGRESIQTLTLPGGRDSIPSPPP